MAHASYIGCKISLISKSDIRYEGVLYSLNPEESTVSLSKVKILGTEDRPTDRPVLGRDEIHDFIIFRGQDIKDLYVKEGPKPQNTLPNDPAIVHHSTRSGSNDPEEGSFGPVGSSVVSTSQSIQRSPDGGITSQNAILSHHDNELHRHSAAGSSNTAIPLMETNTAFSRSEARPPSAQLRPNAQQADTIAFQNVGRDFIRGTGRQRTNGSTAIRDMRAQPEMPVFQRQPQAARSNVNRNQRSGFRQGYNNRVQNSIAGATPGRPTVPDSTTINNELREKFKEDFDFEASNLEFDEVRKKLKEASISDKKSSNDAGEGTSSEVADGESAEGVVGSTTADSDYIYYNKNKSFFDSISCEASTKKERNNKSGGQRRQYGYRQNTTGFSNDGPRRRLNQETFGNVRRSGPPSGSSPQQRYNNRVSQFGRNNGANNSSSWQQGRMSRGRFSREPGSFVPVSL